MHRSKMTIVPTFLLATVLVASVLAIIARGDDAGIPPSGEMKVVQKFKIGGEGRWDYLTIDPETHRLYVPRSTYVMVLNADDGSVMGKVEETKGIHGVALAPDAGRGFTSNGGDDSITVFDLKSLATVGKVKAGKKPDAIIYDPASKRIFAFNGDSNDATAIDAAVDPAKDPAGKQIDLGGAPEFAAADGSGQVFVNLEDKSEVVRIDSKDLKVTGRWPLAPGEAPTGMAIDPEHHRLFVGCHNKLMVVMNADTGEVVAHLPIGAGVDATAFDPKLGLAFASNGDGTLTVVKEADPGKFVVSQNLETQKGARTMALDEKTHKIYLATADFGATPAPTAEHPRQRPSIVPGTFTILVVDRLVVDR